MENFVQLLRNTISQNEQDFKPASEQLIQIETQPQHYVKLLQIALAFNEIETDVRLAAVLQIKNGIHKRWRSYCTNAINKEDKDTIRQNLLLCLNEREHKVSFCYFKHLNTNLLYSKEVAWSTFLQNCKNEELVKV